MNKANIYFWAISLMVLPPCKSAIIRTRTGNNSQESIDALHGYIIVSGGRTANNMTSVSKSYAYDIAAGVWSNLPDLPNPVSGSGLVSHLGMVYSVGGANFASEFNQVNHNEVWALSTSESQWINGPSLHGQLKDGVNAVSLNDSLYVLGGYTNYVQILTCGNGQFFWRSVSEPSVSYSYAGVAVLRGKIYACGAYWGNPSTECECYDPEKDQWTKIAPMHEARQGLAMVALNGYLYVIGGASSNNEQYDPDINEWSYFSAGPRPMFLHAAVTDGTKIYVIGGANDYNQDICYNDFNAYFPELDIWQTYVSYPLALNDLAATYIEQLPN